MSPRLERVWYPAEERERWPERVAHSPLALAETAFRAAVAVRGALFDRGVLRSHRIEGARVVSVGNLNVGGAGKTPLIMLLAERLQSRGERVAVLTRGYGRRSRAPLRFSGRGTLPTVDAAGDEPLLIAQACPAAELFVGADRVESARHAVAAGASVLLLDDGFQHRRLARDVDIVVIDGAARFGNGRLLPRGPLREPPAALRRATLVCWRSAGDSEPPPELPAPVFTVRFEPRGWVAPDGALHPADALAGKAVHLLTGIARPSRVAETIGAVGARIEAVHSFPDHHRFTPAEVAQVLEAARGGILATTEKDRLRLPSNVPAWVLRMALTLVSGTEQLDAQLWPAT